MEYLPLIIQLISGLAGGTAAGKMMPENSLGGIGNAISGLLGGLGGGKLLGMLGMAAAAAGGDGGLDIGSIITSIAGGGVGGGVLTIIIGMIKKAMAK